MDNKLFFPCRADGKPAGVEPWYRECIEILVIGNATGSNLPIIKKVYGKQLTRLILSSCHIIFIGEDAFINLLDLEHLDLSKNSIFHLR